MLPDLGHEFLDDTLLHVAHSNGILEVNPNGPHPIFQLIRGAEREWQMKLEHASQTLDEAVEEYKRRYRRAPPQGFDKWWDYAVANNVQLPDEYDQISEDLEPFWGLDPKELQRIEALYEANNDIYMMEKNDDASMRIARVGGKNTTAVEDKDIPQSARRMLALLHDVQHHLLPFKALFSTLDNPYIMKNHEFRQTLLDAAASQTYVDEGEYPPPPKFGWSWACPPSSPLNRRLYDSAAQTLPRRKCFIHDHRRAMDPCLHPQLLSLHGQFLAYGTGPPADPLFPRFSYSSTPLHHDIRVPHPESWIGDIPRQDDPEWDGKPDERLLWRGSNTGIWYGGDTPWSQSHRTRLVDFANDLNGTTQILLPPRTPRDKVGEGVEVERSKVNPALFDIAFAGAPLQCSPEVCDTLARQFEWRRYQDQAQAGQFKYILDIDGNGWSSRFKRLITSNSLIFKTTVYPEWYMDKIQPWLHYVPIQLDLSDLHDALVFFRGGLYGEGANEDLAKKIASAGRDWSLTFWRSEDMTAYLYRLLLEYARVMSSDREVMSYNP
ncbi:hypothetical protein BDN72DRAFT_766794 [Pluteus cervinus]|uniref:Uncharacterized protein n=1 Tax=Pluteus cervinus TaxID=181527 RepID=A0ACD3AY34_9AGAR|nr:hypothetical protein BDN72DRAFT_766794 [Pluteus cervinus]